MKAFKSISPISIGFAFAIASAALFAIRPIFVKLIYAEGVDSTTLIGFRMLFSLPIYAIMLLLLLRDSEKRSRLTFNNVLAASGVGLFGYYLASYLDLLGLKYVTAQLGRMMLYTYPTFVVILGALFFGKRITTRIVAALSITYVGVAIIFGHDLNEFGPDVITGSLFILGSALSFSLYLLFGKPLIEEMGSRVFTCIALITASIAILVHYSVTRSILDPQVNSTALGWILVIAIFCTVIPTFFTTSAVARIGADNTGIVAMVGPAFTSSFAVAILDERFTVFHALGIGLIVLGVWVLRAKRA
jgi:drug/metabolite transporter (DMT)-like permease